MNDDLFGMIAADATASSTPIAQVLRRSLVLATRLKSAEFRQWVGNELNGYPNNSDVPDYRVVRPTLMGNFFRFGGSQLRNAPIPLFSFPEEVRSSFQDMPLRHPAAQVEAWVTEEKSGVGFQVPSELLVLYGQRIYEHMNCLQAQLRVDRSAIVSVIDGIRTSVLTFVLEIEELFPPDKRIGSGYRPDPNAVKNVYNQTFHGAIGSISQSSSGVLQLTQMAEAEGTEGK